MLKLEGTSNAGLLVWHEIFVEYEALVIPMSTGSVENPKKLTYALERR
jgi:hypothetical protein